MDEKLDLSIIMPCLNEENTVGICIDEARAYIKKSGILGEVVIIDNGSLDRSAEVAAFHGARVVREGRRGYGQALRKGIEESRGKIIIMGDCDTTYDFYDLDKFYLPLLHGSCDIVIGNRFNREAEKGAMPIIHRLGADILSAIARLKYGVRVRDFHCGLRGITKEAVNGLDFMTGGMEFATEMIALASKNGLRIKEVPIGYRKCKKERRSKLKPLSDGLRHLIYIARN